MNFTNFSSFKIPYKFHKSNPYTIQNINLWCKLNDRPFELISNTYVKASEYLQWKCLKDNCSEIFNMSWVNIIQYKGCGFCNGKKTGNNNCLVFTNPQLSKEWHPTKNGDLTPYDVTIGSNKEVWWKCDKGHEWKARINSRKFNGCKCCSGRKSSKEYNLLILYPELCAEWDYNKNNKIPEEYTPYSNQKVWWKCKECGYEWKTVIYIRTGQNKSSCPKCNQSKGENKISTYCNFNNIVDISQYRFQDCKFKKLLSFDHYLSEYNMCIEYQGIQHYEPVDFAGKGEKWAEEQFKENQIKDQVKRDYCKNNNIKLIEIPYWDFNNIEKILNNLLLI